MRITPNDPAVCLHDDLDTDVNAMRDGTGRLIRLDVVVICCDCDQVLDRTSHDPKGPR